MNNKLFLALFLAVAATMNFSCSYISGAINYEDPLTAEEHNNLGVAYEKEEKYKLAKKEYKKAAKKDPALVTPPW